MKNDITAIILTKNEEVNIERCINSVKEWVDRIVVVDSGSTDKTCEIAQKLGAEIYTHPFVHYAAQFNWALQQTHIQTKWVYRIDADEVVPPELAEEIKQQIALHQEDDVHAFLMKHKLYFLGRFLKHGGAYPFVKITVFKPEFADFENRPMGEHIVLKAGRCLTFKNDCLHYDCKSLSAFIDKHNSYSTREVQDYFEHLNRRKEQASLYSRAEWTKKLRDGLYYKLPLFWRARLYYWFRYYLQLGFLDGTPGRVYAFIQAYWYRYLIDAKIYEKQVEEKKK